MYLGIDIGTSSVKAVLIDQSGAIAAQGSDSLTVKSTGPRAFSEQDPEAWWRATVNAVRALPAAPRVPRCGARSA